MWEEGKGSDWEERRELLGAGTTPLSDWVETAQMYSLCDHFMSWAHNLCTFCVHVYNTSIVDL